MMQEEDFDYDQGIYDDLNLLDDEDMVPDFTPLDDTSNFDTSSALDTSEAPPVPPIPASATATSGPKTPAKEDKHSTKEKSTSKKDAAATGALDEPPSPVLAKKTPSRKPTIDSTKVEPPTKLSNAKQPSSESVPTVVAPPSASKPVTLPPIRYAAAAAAAVAPATAPSVPAPTPAAAAPAGLTAQSSSAPAPATETAEEEAKTEEASVPAVVDLGESPAPGLESQQTNVSRPCALSPRPELTPIKGPRTTPAPRFGQRIADRPCAPAVVEPIVPCNITHDERRVTEPRRWCHFASASSSRIWQPRRVIESGSGCRCRVFRQPGVSSGRARQLDAELRHGQGYV